MRKFISVLLALMLLTGSFGFALPAGAEETGGLTLDDWQYWLDEDDGIIGLSNYIGEADTVTVPASFEVGGRVYGTQVGSGGAFRDNTAVKSVSMDEGVSFGGSTFLLFSGCSSLTDADLSGADTSDVESMSRMFYNCSSLRNVNLSGIDTSRVQYMNLMFSGCSSLEELDLSSFDMSSIISIEGMFNGCTRLWGLTGYENWNTSSLENMNHTFTDFAYAIGTKIPVTIDLRNWDLSNLKNSGWCFQYCAARHILLPDNLAIMSAGFLNHAAWIEETSFTVPAGVKKIGYAHTLYDLGPGGFNEIRVAEGNTNYKAIDGILYSADGREMLAVPRAKRFENNTFVIPEGVEFLGELSFSRNATIGKVILPDSFEIKYVPFYDSRYITFQDSGNPNAGTNLSIAIYVYTNIADYEVKDTNPRYASLNGIVYSKEMDRVVAVPSRYNRIIDIPEGAVSWEREAMWAVGSAAVDGMFTYCPGVNIPSTLKVMSPDQFEMINRLHTNRQNTSRPFTITVAENNGNFRLDENGNLTVINTPDQIAANAVIELINNIGVVNYYEACKARIDAAQDAYDALTDDQKLLVNNLFLLTEAVAHYGVLKKRSDDLMAAGAAISRINEIGTVEYTDECKARIDAAQEAYNALTDDQKEFVNNIKWLLDAIARYGELKEAAEQAAAAAAGAITIINEIGAVEYTGECKARIDAASEAYDALTDEQKKYVSNAKTLTDAIARYNALKDAAEQAILDRAAADDVIAIIDTIGEVEYTGACKARFDAAKGAYDALTGTQKGLVSNAQVLTDAIAYYNELKQAAEQAADRAAADDVIALIDSIGAVEYTDECKAKIDAARDAYNALSIRQKALVSNAQILGDAIALYYDLQEEATPPPPPPEDTGACRLCGEHHSGFLGVLIGFFHNIIWFFRNLFS